MPPQSASWTCSACSLAWLERSIGVNPSASEASATSEIGVPENINPTYGLMDGSGLQLMRVLDDYELITSNGWFSFDTVYSIAQQTTGCMGGQGFYHWIALRGIKGSALWIANSAPGYRGIYDTLTRDQFNSLGPFSVVYVEL